MDESDNKYQIKKKPKFEIDFANTRLIPPVQVVLKQIIIVFVTSLLPEAIQSNITKI